MSMPNLNGPFGEWRRASAAVGNAITAGATAAAAFQAFPPGSQYLYMEGRNYAGTAAVISYALNPWLRVLKTTDNFATATGVTDYSAVAQNNKATNGAVVLSSLATTGALWVGAELPFRGVFADVQATNSNTSTAVTAYWSATGPTMATLTSADGTFSGVATFNVDGGITWTVPTDWTVGTLRTITGAVNAIPYSGESLYWVKLTVSAALDASTTLDQVLAMNRSTSYASLTSGRPGVEMMLPTGSGRYGCVEAVTDVGTANLLVNVATIGGGSKFP
ncbi:MAG TPA: hypothetical protein VMT30_09535 [Candidatus Saccharimonadia bacterium]|nr:hypothetical protein [Candidatus Saccharimonadia bacterium]